VQDIPRDDKSHEGELMGSAHRDGLLQDLVQSGGVREINERRGLGMQLAECPSMHAKALQCLRALPRGIDDEVGLVCLSFNDNTCGPTLRCNLRCQDTGSRIKCAGSR
jgi:hypothetical protein